MHPSPSAVWPVVMLAVATALAGCSMFGGAEEAGEDPAPSVSSTTSPSPTPTETTQVAPPTGAVTPEFFGMHDHEPIGASPLGWPDAPVGSLRVWDAGVLWRDVEVTDGVFDFDRLDAIVETAEAHDAEALIVLGQTPAFHARSPGAESFYGAGASSIPDMEAWKRYVREVATRYAGRRVSLQVWNEANVVGFWRGGPAVMAELTKAAYDVLAKVSPRPTLVAPALVTRLIGQRAWMDEFYASVVEGQRVGEYVDVVSLQLYPEADGTPEDTMELLAADRVILAKHGVDKPIWNTEVNFGLTGLPIDPAPTPQQEAYVARTLLLNAANGVARVYWYGWDQQSIVSTVLSEPDGSTTPAGRAFVLVQRWLLGTTVACQVDEQGTYACELAMPEGGVRRVWWNPAATVTVTPPDGATEYQRVDGRKRSITPGQQLKVGRSPVMVESAA